MPSNDAEQVTEVTITHYADPFSPWSAAFQSVLSELQIRYGNRLRIDYKMGGMARNVSQWIEEQGFDDESIVEWIDGVADSSKTSIDSDFIAKTGVKTTWVAALAFTAAMKHDAESAIRFLNRMITGFQVESQSATRDTITRFANESGLDGSRVVREAFFDSNISDFAWQRNGMELAGLGFDSILISDGTNQRVVEKEFSVDAYVQIIDEIAPRLS
ncbi:MAG: hypothetical protein HOE43_01415 [Chloroflexi bacterium]|nr:hypothetical protein [Chloroflexota bacterium]